MAQYGTSILDKAIWDHFTTSGSEVTQTIDFTDQYTPKDFLLVGNASYFVPISTELPVRINILMYYDDDTVDNISVTLKFDNHLTGGGFVVFCDVKQAVVLRSIVVTMRVSGGPLEFFGVELSKNLDTNNGDESVDIPDIYKNPLFDNFGLNPEYIKYYPNKCCNSGFEIYDTSTMLPTFWETSGVVSSDSAFDSTVSLKLPGFTYALQKAEDGLGLVMPEWWGAMYPRTRISFRVKGTGQVQVSPLQGGSTIPAKWWTVNLQRKFTENESAVGVTFDAEPDWPDSLRSFSVELVAGAGPLQVRFDNTTADTIYIDTVIIEADWNGRYPSFYTPGPHSEAAVAGLVTGSEYAEYGDHSWNNSGVTFTMVNAYTDKPIVTAGVDGTASDFASASFNLIIEHIKETIGGVLLYSKIKVTPKGSSVPFPTGAKITIHAICNGKVVRT